MVRPNIKQIIGHNKRATKIYIGNLPENCETTELKGLFEKYGEVKECDIVRNYAFVHMSAEDEAKTAIDALNNFEFKGQKLSVEISHSKVRQRPGMGGKGQCYRCGRQGHWSKECPRNPAARMGGGGRGGDPPPSMYSSRSYSDRYPSYGLERSSYAMDRAAFAEPRFVDRMRPYPDPYERRPVASPQDSYMYYRRPYDGFSYTRRSPPPTLSSGSRYDFTQDPTFAVDRIQSATRRAPVY